MGGCSIHVGHRQKRAWAKNGEFGVRGVQEERVRSCVKRVRGNIEVECIGEICRSGVVERLLAEGRDLIVNM